MEYFQKETKQIHDIEVLKILGHIRNCVLNTEQYPQNLKGACGPSALITQLILEELGIESVIYMNKKHYFVVTSKGNLVDLTATQIDHKIFHAIETRQVDDAAWFADNTPGCAGFYDMAGDNLLMSGKAADILTPSPDLHDDAKAVDRLLRRALSVLNGQKLTKPSAQPSEESLRKKTEELKIAVKTMILSMGASPDELILSTESFNIDSVPHATIRR